MDAGTAKGKQPPIPDPHNKLDALDCAQLGIRSLAEFEKLLEKYVPLPFGRRIKLFAPRPPEVH